MRLARGRFAFQGLPARICWLGYGERAKMGEAMNDLVKKGRNLRAHRHRPRPPRHRLRRQPLSRNRKDARRLRRGSRLAHPQRAAQHRFRRYLGQLPSRRRRRHGLLAPRRPGHRRRRHRDGRAQDCPRAQQRSRHRRSPPRRRRLRVSPSKPPERREFTFRWQGSRR